jgi:cation transport regulator ChaB
MLSYENMFIMALNHYKEDASKKDDNIFETGFY